MSARITPVKAVPVKELESPKLGAYDHFLAGMAKGMWAPALIMGVMIIVAAFVIGLYAADAAASYLGESKAVREAAGAGSALVADRVYFSVITAWLPAAKFLGMGLIFAGITMLLASIIDALRRTGFGVQKALKSEIVLPKKPVSGQLFPPFMAMGLMILIGTFVVGLVLAGIVGEYNLASQVELDAAVAGSVPLGQLADITAIKLWLEPLKFLGVALMLTGIALALDAIRRTLKAQAVRIIDIVNGDVTRGDVQKYDATTGKKIA